MGAGITRKNAVINEKNAPSIVVDGIGFQTAYLEGRLIFDPSTGVWVDTGSVFVLIASLPGAATIPGAPNHSIQFNNGGAFGGNAAMLFDPAGDLYLSAATNGNYILFALDGTVTIQSTNGKNVNINSSNQINLNSLNDLLISSIAGSITLLSWTNLLLSCNAAGNSILLNNAGGIDINSNNGANVNIVGDGQIVLRSDKGDMVLRTLNAHAINIQSNGAVVVTTDNGAITLRSTGNLNLITNLGSGGNIQLNSDTTITLTSNLAITFATPKVLDLSNVNSGLLMPKMTQAQRLALVAPTIATVVYQTDTVGLSLEGLYIFKSGGWTFIA